MMEHFLKALRMGSGFSGLEGLRVLSRLRGFGVSSGVEVHGGRDEENEDGGGGSMRPLGVG